MDLFLTIIHAITKVHPPHLLVVHFPIALTGAALFFMLLAIWRKKDIFEKIAFADISLAAASTVVAAILGIRDNLVYFQGNAANHTAKIILAILLFIITTVTAIVRWKNPDLLHTRTANIFYILAYFVSFAIASVLGFLGGVIIYGV